jgi:hypothetical protein
LFGAVLTERSTDWVWATARSVAFAKMAMPVASAKITRIFNSFGLKRAPSYRQPAYGWRKRRRPASIRDGRACFIFTTFASKALINQSDSLTAP